MKNNINKKARTKCVKNSQGKQSQQQKETALQQQQRTLFCQKHHKTYDVTDESNMNEPLIQNHTIEFHNTKHTYYRQVHQGVDGSSKVNKPRPNFLIKFQNTDYENQ